MPRVSRQPVSESLMRLLDYPFSKKKLQNILLIFFQKLSEILIFNKHNVKRKDIYIYIYVDVVVGKEMISRAPAEMAVVRENKVLWAYGPAERGSCSWRGGGRAVMDGLGSPRMVRVAPITFRD